MAITYPVELPTIDGMSFRYFAAVLDYAQASSESPFTLEEQVYSYEAERWVLSVQYPPLTPVQAKAIRAFILSLKGRIGTFKIGDPLNALPGGSPGNDVKVNGNGQVGYELNVKGLIANATPAFVAGDDIEVNDRIYTVVKTVNASAGGTATLDIMPSLRGTVTDNQVVKTANAQGLFRLEQAKIGWSGSSDRSYDISFTAVEAK